MSVERCPHCGGNVEPGHVGCPWCYGSLGRDADHEVSEGPTLLASGEDWVRSLQYCEVLGGYGYPLPLGTPLRVTIDPRGFHFGRGGDPLATIPMDTIEAIEIGGPGTTSKGGGFIGGGFGLDGAVSGMLVAGVLNALTTRTSVLTVVAVLASDGEVWFAHTLAEPAAVRVELAPAFVAIRRHARQRSSPRGDRRPAAG